ncbi:putative ferredoxin [Haematococcus lacustris]
MATILGRGTLPNGATRHPACRGTVCVRAVQQAPEKETEAKASTGDRPQASAPRSMLVELGPIGLTFGTAVEENACSTAGSDQPPLKSIHSMTTAEWRAQYEKDGMVDLWVEEEFNAGSRLVGGRAVHRGGTYGINTGEGPSQGTAAVHKVKIHDHYGQQTVDVQVPEDRYILWEAEDEGLQLPYACRMGCCTACAVRIKEGAMHQPEALGISKELKEQGYGLMCVGYPLTDLVLETVSEDEVYELQFGEYFAKQALDPTNAVNIERDDYALSIANMDE